MTPRTMLAEASILHSLAIGLVIAGVVILGFTFRQSFGQAFRRLFARSPGVSPGRSMNSSSGIGRDDSGGRSNHLDATLQDADELAHLIADRLDRQAARLEQLIAAADDRLNRLEQAAQVQIEARPAAPRRDSADPIARQIYELSDRGLPPVEIARQLNQHTGKVELILALRQERSQERTGYR